MKRSVSFAILAVLLARPLLAGDSMATYEITLTATGASSGVKAAVRGVAAAYGATVEPGAINEGRRTFVLRMKPESAALMRGDPRIQSARPLQSRAHVSTILPPMDLGVYLYDGAGNIESIGNDQFRYDEAGRLKSATVNGSANQQTFTYDAFGNRKDAARAASASVCIGNTQCEISAPVETTNTNHLTAATYDDAGNVTVLDGTYNYSYDSLNMVRSTGGHDYVYTADDERIASVSGGVWTWTIRSPGQQVLSEFTSSGTNGASNWKWTRDHIWRGASLLAVEEKNASDVNVTRHFHLDHLGTPRLITNGTGQQIGLHAYYPFGTELLSSTTEAPPDNIKFTGHEWDDLGGDIHALTYMHARYYSASLGRFLSVDPVLDMEKATHAPQMWNRYAYVTDNPLRFTDPTGKYVCNGTDAECKTIEVGLGKMQEAADGLKKSDPRKAELNAVIAAYGKPGDAKTKISTVWANPRKPDGTPLLGPGKLGQAGRSGNLFLSLTNIGIKAKGDSPTAFTILGGTMSHEGKHELQPAVVGLEGRPSFLSMIFYEKQAYTVEQGYYQGLGRADMAPDPTAGAFGSANAGCNTPQGCNP
jgi:RHS repeat-associated protein